MDKDGYDYQAILPSVEKLITAKPVAFLLGTDRHLDEGTPDQETRVGIIPRQAEALREWLEKAGIVVNLYMIRDAGIGSGYSNEEYARAGVNIIEEAELATLPAVDVVHALKEPSHYEKNIRGPFVRIGALHTGDFEEDRGLASLLERKNFSAIFDGSFIGTFSHKLSGGYMIPIKGSMSEFAGNIAADMVANHLRNQKARGRVVICGGGIVGRWAVNRLSSNHADCCSEILVIEVRSATCEELTERFRKKKYIQIKQEDSVSAKDLQNADALILAVATEEVAPKVVEVSSLISMNDGALVIDISSDEGGSVVTPEGGATVERAIANLNKSLTYIADKHLPRRDLNKASREHGKAVLPYLGVLLYLIAREGSSIAALRTITQNKCEAHINDYFDSLICDLRHGLAFSGPKPIRLFKIVRKPQEIGKFLDKHNIAYETGDPFP